MDEAKFWDGIFERSIIFDALDGNVNCKECPYHGKICDSYDESVYCGEVLKSQYEKFKEKGNR